MTRPIDRTVTLSPREFALAVQVGAQRLAESTERGHNHASTYQRDYLKRLEEETLGACGEMALCKALRWFWSPSVGTFHAVADVGRNVEVRCTRRPDGALIVRENDAPERWYVLVTGEPPTFTVRGYIRGAAARRPEYIRDPHGHRPSWFVPQSALTPMPARAAS